MIGSRSGSAAPEGSSQRSVGAFKPDTTVTFEPLLLTAHNPSPMTGSGNNTYLLVGDRGPATLIDAGVGEPQHLADLASAPGGHGCVSGSGLHQMPVAGRRCAVSRDMAIGRRRRCDRRRR